MMSADFIYEIALTRIPNIGCVHARTLVQHLGGAAAIFRSSKSTLEKIEGIGSVRANNIKRYNGWKEDEKEIVFIRKYGIVPLFITQPNFPQRLVHHCYDAPVMLYYRGTADLNASKMIAIVGTRNNSEYGKQFTERLIRELVQHDVVIVSGLAFGIDAIAHRAAMKNILPTVGVVGHGMDFMYPIEHTALAKEMIRNGGGVLTEFTSGTKPDRHNFPGRNRIVAGITDATIVVETGIKGGSMITAELANSYNRDVFAVPGRISDFKSEGCNHLIKTNKAVLLTDASQLIEVMGWEKKNVQSKKLQRLLFENLSDNEKKIVRIMMDKGTVHIDEIGVQANLPVSTVAASILNLEMENVIRALPGKRYVLI